MKYFYIILFSCFAHGQVIFSEIMINPAGTDSPNEFVELFNLTDSEVHLSGWEICDIASSDEIIGDSLAEIIRIPPLSYCLIMEGDYDGIMYRDKIPATVPVFYVGTTTIGNNLGNSSDSLFLVDDHGDTVANTSWDRSTPPGYSLERIRLNRPDTPVNWTVSRDSLGTPGYINSVTPLEVDGAILADSSHFHPDLANPGESAVLHALVTNSGILPLSGNILLTSESSIIASASLPEIDQSDTTQVELHFTAPEPGLHEWTVSLEIPGDLDSSNNYDFVTLKVRFQPLTVVLNEFLAAPAGDQTEFVELASISEQPIKLTGWRVTDSNPGNNYLFPDYILNPGALLVIAPDSALLDYCPDTANYITPSGGFPTLNNGGDQVRLFDPFDTLIDSLDYSGEWPIKKGVSMEKIHAAAPSPLPDNWRLSEDSTGMTPGRANSVTPGRIDGKIIPGSIHHSPHYPQDHETVNLSCRLTNCGMDIFSGILSVYDEFGSELGNSPVNSVSPTDTITQTIILPPLTSGIHCLSISLEISGDVFPGNNQFSDTLLVSYTFGSIQLNEFLVQPEEGVSEFVEIYTTNSIRLQGWGIGDNTGMVRLLPEILLNAGSLCVLAPDSSWWHAVIKSNSALIVPLGWPSLNNTADAIFIYDHTGKIIDSLAYDQEWPFYPNRSLEKLRPEFESSDPKHWSTAINAAGCTPGLPNSIFVETPAEKAVADYSPNPFSPDGDGFEDELIIRYSLPFDTATLTVQVFDVMGRTIYVPAWNLAVAREGIARWNGRTAQGRIARTGIYIMKLEARDMGSRKSWEDVQTVVVVNRLNN